MALLRKWWLMLLTLSLLVVNAASCTGPNLPPVINGIDVSTERVEVNGTLNLVCTAVDPEGKTVSYLWTADSGEINGEGSTVEWRAPAMAGSYTIDVCVHDDKGNESNERIVLCVSETRPPVISGLFSEPAVIGQGASGTLKCQASDPGGLALSYRWQVEGGILSGSGPEVQWTAPLEKKSSVVKVTVTNEAGMAAVMSLNISLPPNNTPQITELNAEPSYMNPGDESVITCAAEDEDGDVLEYRWRINDEELEETGDTVSWIAPEDCTVYNVIAEVDDGRGGVAQKSVRIRVVKAGG